MNPKQLDFLQHALGVDQYGQGQQYRNHFVTAPDGADGQVCESLVALGYMRIMTMHPELTGGDTCYLVTEAGKAAMAAESPKPPPPIKRTPGQQRYLDWINADSGLTFMEWLKERRQLAKGVMAR